MTPLEVDRTPWLDSLTVSYTLHPLLLQEIEEALGDSPLTDGLLQFRVAWWLVPGHKANSREADIIEQSSPSTGPDTVCSVILEGTPIQSGNITQDRAVGKYSFSKKNLPCFSHLT